MSIPRNVAAHIAALIGGTQDWEVVDISEGDHVFARPIRAISFAVDGDIVLEKADGTDGTIPAGHLSTGVLHPINGATAVRETVTTADDIIGWF